jgi:hypothetical protein
MKTHDTRTQISIRKRLSPAFNNEEAIEIKNFNMPVFYWQTAEREANVCANILGY